MFTVKPLARRQTVKLTVKPMVKKNLAPHQDRASFINMVMATEGKSYSEAIRSWDRKARQNA